MPAKDILHAQNSDDNSRVDRKHGGGIAQRECRARRSNLCVFVCGCVCVFVCVRVRIEIGSPDAEMMLHPPAVYHIEKAHPPLPPFLLQGSLDPVLPPDPPNPLKGKNPLHPAWDKAIGQSESVPLSMLQEIKGDCHSVIGLCLHVYMYTYISVSIFTFMGSSLRTVGGGPPLHAARDQK